MQQRYYLVNSIMYIEVNLMSYLEMLPNFKHKILSKTHGI